jgi:NADH:ubiquinone oxidoreductase subunit 6 (subunit J)
VMSVMSDQAVRIIASKNPFDGVTINLDFLGPAFKSTWQLWLGGAWGLGIIVLAFFMIRAMVGLKDAKNKKNPQKAEAAKGRVQGTAAALIGTVLLPMIVGALILAAGS